MQVSFACVLETQIKASFFAKNFARITEFWQFASSRHTVLYEENECAQGQSRSHTVNSIRKWSWVCLNTMADTAELDFNLADLTRLSDDVFILILVSSFSLFGMLHCITFFHKRKADTYFLIYFRTVPVWWHLPVSAQGEGSWWFWHNFQQMSRVRERGYHWL